ncbi:hypothetical protein MMC25_002357 [Agyrium rufum]|nr:hypothetical protein [Agyrium rufum]
MPPQDSDSSDDGLDSFTTTNVLLGYASKEPTDDTISQLGGQPVWLDSSSPPSASLAKCKICNDFMVLLLQLHGDLPEYFPDHERRLFIFACRRKTCWKKKGCVRAIRSVRVSKPPTSAERKPESPTKPNEADLSSSPFNGLGNSLFGGTSPTPSSSAKLNPFSMSNSSDPAKPFASSFVANPFAPKSTSSPPAKNSNPQIQINDEVKDDLPATFASKARISSPPPSTSTPAASKEPWPPTSALPKAYPKFHLDADYESLDATAPSSSSIPSLNGINHQAMNIDDAGPSSSTKAEAEDDKEAFESELNKTFQHFADRLAQNPEQVLRYEFRGLPLLYSKTDEVGKMSFANAKVKTTVSASGSSSGGKKMPRCENCTAERVFELQLTPHAIAELEEDDEDVGLDGMDWGTIILGVCGRDCAERGFDGGVVGYVEEWVGVQWEEAR